MVNATELLPPGTVASRSGELMAIICSLNTIAFFAYGLRMYSRATPTPHFGVDDCFISLGMGSMLVTWVVTILGIKAGNGTRAALLEPQQLADAMKWSIVQFFPQIWAMAFIRMSIACLLLRFRQDRLWRVVLLVLVALQIAMAAITTVAQALMAVPLASFWDPDIPAEPWHIDPHITLAAVYTNSIVGIITDLVFSLMPILFLRHIGLPLRERIVLSVLMGLGALTTAASIVKTVLVGNYGAGGDYTWSAFEPVVWVLAEQVVAVIAASVPCLKALFEQCLSRLGLMSAKGTQATRSLARAYSIYGARSEASSLHRLPSRHRPPLPFGTPRSTLGFSLSDIEDGNETDSTKPEEAHIEEGRLGVFSKVGVGKTTVYVINERGRFPAQGFQTREVSSQAGRMGTGITKTTEIIYNSSSNEGK